MIKGFTGFTLTAKTEQDIDFRDRVVNIAWTETRGLAPVVERHLVLLLFRLESRTGGVGIGAVGEHLHDMVQLVNDFLLLAHLLQHMRQSQAGLEVQGFDGEEGIVVGLRLGIVALLLMDVSPEEERCEVSFVSTQDTAVLRQGIVPLLQIDVRLGLQQPKVNIMTNVEMMSTPGMMARPTSTPVLPPSSRASSTRTKSVCRGSSGCVS